MRLAWLFLVVATAGFARAPAAADIAGTYTLVSATRRIVATGVVTEAYGQHPKGMAMYGTDGRMLLVITNDNRPKPTSTSDLTDDQRVQLFRTMQAYGGTYTFHGDRIEHHVDFSWDEIRAGTTVVRDVTRNGDELTYVTRPAPFSEDGIESIVTVVWRKIKRL